MVQAFGFYVGALAAATFAGFTMTVGGPDTVVAAVGIPLLVGAVGTAAVALRNRKEAIA